ncbi:MAG: phenylalanine--tRNA ligase subunit beta [Bacilli bacterium]|nr:phenylalanine--tRNA ligase subunit beta [Bacilli bacterium]
MRISCNILKKHLKNSDKIDFISIWDKFTIRSAEVEEVIIKGNNFDNVVTAKIIECEKHPESSKLSILKVTDGKEDYQIVCGAPNVKVGLIGALIKVGGRIDDMMITKRKLAGVESCGMMCSARELGIGDDHDGILELPTDTPLGVSIKDVLPVEDIIVEIDNKSLTNRPDLWGHYGIAREIAAITGHELLPLEISEPEKVGKKLKVDIKNPELCYRYTSIKLDNIINNKTPLWMQIFLYYAGMKSINLIVDITNYLMLELGQPMHAFDSRVVQNIEVGLAKDGDKYTTLDGIERILSDKDLMIKNGGQYFGIAGVMGGLDSEILEDTTSIILESASFDAGTIRKTAISLGLRTEASSRYEKSLDPNLTMIAAKRYYKLLKDENPDLIIASDLTDVYPNEFKEKEVILKKSLLTKYFDFVMPDNDVKSILESLEFKVKVNKNDYKVIVPTFRANKDVTIPADIIEEIGRIYGYENFIPKAIKMDLSFYKDEPSYDDSYNLKHYLATKYNLNEVHSYLWNKTSFLNDLNIEKDNIKLISKNEDNILRDDLNLTMLEIAKANIKERDNFGVFEIGTVIKDGENHRMLSILLSSENDKLKYSFNKAKEIVTSIFRELKNVDLVFEFGKSKDYYNQDLTLNIIVNNLIIGQVKPFTRSVSSKISKKNSFVVIELDLEEYFNLSLEKPSYQEISKYPTTELDYTIITKRGEYFNKLEEILDKFTSPIILKRELIDIYLEEDSKKVTIRFLVGSYDKTLTSDELQNFKDEFIKFLHNNDLSIIEE